MAYIKPKDSDRDETRRKIEEYVDAAPHLGRGHIVPQDNDSSWYVPDEVAEQLGFDRDETWDTETDTDQTTSDGEADENPDETSDENPDENPEDETAEEPDEAPKQERRRPGRPPKNTTNQE